MSHNDFEVLQDIQIAFSERINKGSIDRRLWFRFGLLLS